MDDPLLEMHAGAKKFQSRVSNRRVFRIYMLAKNPVLGVTGATLEHIDTFQARMLLPESRAIKSLFGRTFAAAVCAAIETTSGAMLVLHMRNQERKFKADLRSLNVETLCGKPTKMRVLCHDGAKYADFVRRAVSGEENLETFDINVVDEHGQPTHHCTLTWCLN